MYKEKIGFSQVVWCREDPKAWCKTQWKGKPSIVIKNNDNDNNNNEEWEEKQQNTESE